MNKEELAKKINDLLDIEERKQQKALDKYKAMSVTCSLGSITILTTLTDEEKELFPTLEEFNKKQFICTLINNELGITKLFPY